MYVVVEISADLYFEPLYGYPRSSFSSQFFRLSSFFQIEIV